VRSIKSATARDCLCLRIARHGYTRALIRTVGRERICPAVFHHSQAHSVGRQIRPLPASTGLRNAVTVVASCSSVSSCLQRLHGGE
jgi:hypothetical protein